jgi:hypothetical protein
MFYKDYYGKTDSGGLVYLKKNKINYSLVPSMVFLLMTTIILSAYAQNGTNTVNLSSFLSGIDNAKNKTSTVAVSFANNQTGKPWLGISMVNVTEIDPSYAQNIGLNQSTGVLVAEVKPGSPAEKVGLLPPKLSTYLPNQTPKILNGDVILKIDNLAVSNPEDAGLAIQNKKIGDNLTLTVLRSGQSKEVTITPISKPDFLEYKDPGGLYTVLYHSNWTAVEPEQLQEITQQSERMQELIQPETVQQLASSFVKPNSPGTSISIVKNPGNTSGISDIEMEAMANEGFAHALRSENGTVVQDIECEKYKVDGNKACSYVIGIGDLGAFYTMQVLTIVGGQSYGFTYGSLEQNFKADLPILDRMLQSFNAIDSQTS